MGLTVEDLIQVEDYAAKLRHGSESFDEKLCASSDNENEIIGSRSLNPQSGLPRRPSLTNKQLDKLTFELERLHHESKENRDLIRRTEADLSKTKDENRALESVIREISLTLIKTRSSSPDDMSFSSISKLIKLLESKEKRLRAADIKDAMATEDIVEMNSVLREELTQVRSLLEESTSTSDNLQRELEAARKEATKYKEKAEMPRKRLLHLPADLALGTVHDYSALVEQLIECLLDLETKDKVIMDNRKALQDYHVLSPILSSI